MDQGGRKVVKGGGEGLITVKEGGGYGVILIWREHREGCGVIIFDLWGRTGRGGN